MRGLPGATADRIGRVLVSHLMLEHYLDRCLRAVAPSDFNFSRPSLSFAQKVDILSGPESHIVGAGMVPGIKRVNKIRNALAHDLQAEITTADIQPLADLLRHVGKGRAPAIAKDPIAVVETFAAVAIAGMAAFVSAYEAAGNPAVLEAMKSRTAANKALNATVGRGRPPAR